MNRPADSETISPLVERLFRAESGRLVAVLTRLLGSANISLAEDVTQDALLAALHHWPRDGVPSNPSAWLLQVARRRALDAIRREGRFAAREAEIARDLAAAAVAQIPIPGGDVFADDQLRMILLCCHPALSRESRVALTLKTVGGFSVAEIARAFLADETAVAQRLVRAKRTLRQEDAPFEMPPGPEIPARLDAALDVLYLMFNEGHTAHEGQELLRADLCHEALRLAELLLSDSLTAQPRVHALAALFCFHTARLAARTDAGGAQVLLANQDRGIWDRELITRGLRHLESSAFGDTLSEYHLEADIAGAHAVAPSWEATDWRRIIAAYDALFERTGSPIVALNRVVAIRELHGPARALAELDAAHIGDVLSGYHLLHSVRGELFHALGRREDAAASFARAVTLARSEPVRAHTQDRLNAVTLRSDRG